MRISDWSSDVCSSDLIGGLLNDGRQARKPTVDVHFHGRGREADLARRFIDTVALHLDQQDRLRLRGAKLVEQAGQDGAADHRSLVVGDGYLVRQLVHGPARQAGPEVHTYELQSLMRT